VPDEQAVFEVLSNPDTAPPVIQSISYNVTSVNVSAASATVKATVRLTDVGRGVDPDSGQSYFAFAGPTTTDKYPVFSSNLRLISGDANDGIYEMDLVIPRYAEPGAWRIWYAQLRDYAGGSSYYDRTYNPPPAGSFTVVSSPADTQRPAVTSVSLSPALVNTSLASQVVYLTFSVTDDRSGIRNPYGCHGYLISPSGDQTAGGTWGTLQSGTLLSGVFQAVLTLPQFAEIGTWRIGYLYCVDAAGNQRGYSRDELTALGLNRSLTVIQPSNVSDGTIPPAGGTFEDNASETQLIFPPGSVAANTNIAVDLLTQPPAIPAPTGFARATGFVNVELTPKPTAPFPAPGVTLTIPLESQLPAGTILVLYKINPSTGTLVPAVSVTGGPVEGIVNANGLSATFTGISGFSTVIGLTPPGRPGDLNGDNQVNCEDITLIRNSWNKRQGQRGFDDRADFNRDRVVNLQDLAGVARYLPRRTRCN
jgi:hypothetical protein